MSASDDISRSPPVTKYSCFLFFQRKDTGRMPPKKGGRRRKKVEDSDEEEEVVPARRGSSKRDEDYVWEEDQCEEANVESSKKGRRKKKSVVWNDNDCRADVCLRPPGTSRYKSSIISSSDTSSTYQVGLL